jgi:hypothetical protein
LEILIPVIISLQQEFCFLAGKAAECELVLVLPIGRSGVFFSQGQDKLGIREIDADFFCREAPY